MSKDEDLVRRARVGDELAFDELWRRHAPALVELAQRARGAAVHDVLAAAYLDASKGIAQFEDAGPDGLRRWLLGFVEARLAGPGAVAADMHAATKQALAKLAPREREVLRLLHEKRLAREDAAIRLRCSPDEVQALHEQALARFAELIRKRTR